MPHYEFSSATPDKKTFVKILALVAYEKASNLSALWQPPRRTMLVAFSVITSRRAVKLRFFFTQVSGGRDASSRFCFAPANDARRMRHDV